MHQRAFTLLLVLLFPMATNGFRSIITMRRTSLGMVVGRFAGGAQSTRSFNGTGGWDDHDEEDYATATRKKRESAGKSKRRKNNNFNRNQYGNGRSNYQGGGGRNNRQQQQFDIMDKNRINMRLLEQEAGFDHLYGISPVLNALTAQQRDFETPYMPINNNEDDDEEEEPIKPEAQTRPHLFVQQESSSSSSSRTADKAAAVSKALELAKDISLPIAFVDKGVLNTLSNNRPHQGLVLRCGKLEFETFESFRDHNFWLVLDQVVDPQNFGALVRTAEFLQVPAILVCDKHSAPASAVVSAASAGALESSTVKIYSTSSLPRALASAATASTIIGAAANVRPDFNAPLFQLDEFPPELLLDPTLLVLGSEGHGLRFSVAKACTHFCQIPGDGVVDSLNVSVSGGIFLWHFLRSIRNKSTA